MSRSGIVRKIYWIDLFCGAGGTTTGIHLAEASCEVVACVNHDKIAIESHKENHPNCIHFTEDIRDFEVVRKLKKLVDRLRKENPGCIINIWASLECTNYSKAKGGLPRDADSRTLAEHLYMYLEELDIDYLYIENVREFMAWGPLDKNGRPISRKNGRDYIKWVNKIKSFGYNHDFKLLNAADYGAYTSRIRYFGIFAKRGLPIEFPEATHVKKLPDNEGMFKENKKKWKAVKDVLELDVEGNSIFERKKPLSENTLKRIYAGLIKFVAGGKDKFTKVYNGGNDMQRVKSLDEPVGSLTTQNSHAIVSTNFLYHNHGGDPSTKVWYINRPNRVVTGSGNHYKVFIKKYYSGRPEGNVISVDGPAGTITTIDGQALVRSDFLQSYYGNGQVHSTDEPCPTITTKDRFSKINPQFFMNNYSSGGEHTDLNNPSPSMTGVPKSNLVTAIKDHYLLNPQFSSKGSDVNSPSPTIIARQDKKPLSLISYQKRNDVAIIVWEDDSEMTVKIKEFMALYDIVDIKMRMLLIKELKKIQGFPSDYVLKGTKTDQKKFIGNSVETTVARKLAESNYSALINHLNAA